MLKIGTIALFSAKLISELHSVFEHMHATMKHWVLMLAMMSPKDCIFCIGLYGESAREHFLLFIFMLLNVLAVQKY